MKTLLGSTLEELKGIVSQYGLPAFTAKQIADWLYKKHITSIDQMTNISVKGREALKANYCVGITEPIWSAASVDGTKKYLFQTTHGQIETVFIPEDDRGTLCVSCQVGCKMNCQFCMTGKQGWSGSLTAAEIMNQICGIPEVDRLTNIVFMGMGEPMQNLDAIRKSIQILTNKDGRALSGRRITLSTSGIIKGIYDLADNEPQIRLAVSLTTADTELRTSLMPVTIGNPLDELKKAISNHECFSLYSVKKWVLKKYKKCVDFLNSGGKACGKKWKKQQSAQSTSLLFFAKS